MRMIEQLANLPAHTLGFRASGKVTGHDYESTLMPAVELALKSHLSINLIYHIAENFESFDTAAVWDDAKIGLKHLSSWHRIAVISDLAWIQTGIKAVGFIMPCEVQLYSQQQLNEAIAWASEAIEQ